MVLLVMVLGEGQPVPDLTEGPGGSSHWFGYICSTGLPIGHSSFFVLFSVLELAGVFKVVQFSSGSD